MALESAQVEEALLSAGTSRSTCCYFVDPETMAKRPADTQLTRDDLDREDSREQEVTYQDTGPQIASQEILAKRPILKAARRSTAANRSSTPSNSPFASLLSKPLIAPSASQGGIGLFQNSFLSSSAQESKPLATTMSTLQNGSKSLVSEPKNTSEKDLLSSLNESFVNHLKQVFSVDKSVSFRRNCEEYIKFLDQLDAKTTSQPSISASTKSSAPPTAASLVQPSVPTLTSTPVTSTFSFFANTVSQAPTQASSAPVVTTVSTSSSPASVSAFSSKPAFNFGTSLDSNFKFGSSVAASSAAPIVFGNGAFASSNKPQFGTNIYAAPTFGGFLNSSTSIPPTAAKAPSKENPEDPEGEGDNDEPPVLTDAKMDEEGSIYSKVIKLFFHKDKKFEPMGKGMVHVKKLPTGKHQLLVRGENALGSIWLNVILDKTVTIKKQGKKDVQCLCFTKCPADDSDEMKYVTYLLRTPSESDADDLELHLSRFQEVYE